MIFTVHGWVTMDQKQIDFTRGEQLHILGEFCRSLPAKVRARESRRFVGISKSAIALTLRNIDDRAPNGGFCFCSLESLSSDTGLSIRTIQRVIRWMDDEGLLIKKRRGNMATNQLRIVWNALADFEFSKLTEPTHSDTPQTGSDTPCVHSDMPWVPSDTPSGGVPDMPPVAYITENLTAKETQPINRKGNRVIGEIDVELFDYLLDRIGRAVPVSKPSDSILQIKVAVLASARVGGCLSQADLFSALEAVTFNGPDNPSSYFCSCIRNRLKLSSRAFGRLLGVVPIPEAFCEVAQ